MILDRLRSKINGRHRAGGFAHLLPDWLMAVILCFVLGMVLAPLAISVFGVQGRAARWMVLAGVTLLLYLLGGLFVRLADSSRQK